MPFGFHLAMDTLPSGKPQVGGFRSALAGFRLSLSCPFRLLHTFHLLRPARGYPRVWIWHPSFGRQRDFDPPEQRAAQRTLRSSPPLTAASVLSASRFFRLHLFPCHRQPGSQVPYESPNEIPAAYTPDTAWSVSRYPPCSFPGTGCRSRF